MKIERTLTITFAGTASAILGFSVAAFSTELAAFLMILGVGLLVISLCFILTIDLRVFDTLKWHLEEWRYKKRRENIRLKAHIYRFLSQHQSLRSNDPRQGFLKTKVRDVSQYEITDIKITKSWEHIHFTITLGKPGLLIGVSGTTLDSLVLYLQKVIDKHVHIHIKEARVWS